MEEGTIVDGKQTTPTPEQAAAATAAAVVAAAAAEKAKQDAALLDHNGNPKTDTGGDTNRGGEGDVETKVDTSIDVEVDQKALETKVTSNAKQVEDLIKSAGISPEELIKGANQETGELSVADKAKLITKHGEAIAGLIEGNIGKIINDVRTIGAAKDNAVYKMLETEFKGVTEQTGKETWKELSGWVKEHVDVDTRKAYNEMLNKGGVSASLAVKAMISSFKKREGVTVEAHLLDGDEAVATTGRVITRAEYNAQLDKLMNTGHDYDTSPEVAALNKKRMKSMKLGM